MGIGLGIVLMAAGAILFWAVDASIEAVNLDVVGVILMIVGAASFVWGSVIAATTTDRRVIEE